MDKKTLKTRVIQLASAVGLGLCLSLVVGFKAGDAMPDLSQLKLEGSLPPELKGKVVLLDFWASWCEPCKASFPVMDELQKKYASQGLVVVAVNVDEDRANMDRFLKKNEASFTVMRDAGHKFVARAGITTMPSSFLIDKDGWVRFVHSGFKGVESKLKYEQEIESLLKK